MFFRAAAFRADAFAARFLGGDLGAGGGGGTGGTGGVTGTGGWKERAHARDYDYLESAEIRHRRALERERLQISEAEQRKLDRAAKKIARTLPRADQRLLVAPAVMAQPAFDAILMALRPSEGEVMALAQAIVDRVLFLAELARQEEEEERQIMHLLMQM